MNEPEYTKGTVVEISHAKVCRRYPDIKSVH